MLSTSLDHLVHEHLHGVDAQAPGFGVSGVPGSRQHEVIHPAHALPRVPQARRHAGAEHGDDHHVARRGVVLARQQLRRLEAELPVQVARDRLFHGYLRS
jgi:hypothetical protein